MDSSQSCEQHHDQTTASVSNVFVGRKLELKLLISGLKNTEKSKGSVILLKGEAGIGKTRIAHEISLAAKKRNFCVLWGRCYEEQGAPSFWPWIEAIRDFIGAHSSEQIRDALGEGAADVAQIVTELRTSLPLTEPPKKLNPEESRFRLYDSIRNFFRRVAKETPVLIVFDNLHCADRSSLRLLELVAQDACDARLLIVGTYKDTNLSLENPLSETLGEVSRLSHILPSQHERF